MSGARRKAPAALAILIAAVGHAQATGGLSCTGHDKASEFLASSVVPYGRGSPIVDFRAELKIRLKEGPADLRELALGAAGLVHHWIHGRDVKLLVFWENADTAYRSVQLAVQTRLGPGEDTESTGSYELTVSFTEGKPGDELRKLVARGRAKCSVGW